MWHIFLMAQNLSKRVRIKEVSIHICILTYTRIEASSWLHVFVGGRSTYVGLFFAFAMKLVPGASQSKQQISKQEGASLETDPSLLTFSSTLTYFNNAPNQALHYLIYR
jgi:hypothetical protein